MPRPRVIVMNSASVDGRVAVTRDALLLYGDKRWTAIQGQDDFDVYGWLNSTYHPQAMLEGSGSFICDDAQPSPLPPCEGDPAPLYQDFLPDAIIHRPGHRGWFTAVDGRGRIRWQFKEWPDEAWKGWYALAWVALRTPPEYLAYLQREQIPYLVAGENRVNLALALEKMQEKLGVQSLVSTAGGRLNGALVRAGLVDEIDLLLHPGIIGGLDVPSLFDSPALGPEEMPIRLNLTSCQVRPGGSLWLHYQVVGS